MKTIKRKYEKCPPELMVNVNTKYLRAIIHKKRLNQSELSVKMGFCPEYLSNAVGDGRMPKDLLKLLSDLLGFIYKDALAGIPKKRMTLEDMGDLDDFLEFLTNSKKK